MIRTAYAMMYLMFSFNKKKKRLPHFDVTTVNLAKANDKVIVLIVASGLKWLETLIICV